MGSMFEPRQVPSNSWHAWLREALRLITERWALNATLSVGSILLLYLLPFEVAAFLAPLYIAVWLGAFCLIAEATDKRSALTMNKWKAASKGLVRLLVFAILTEVVVLLVVGLAGYLRSSAHFFADGVAQISSFGIGTFALLCLAGGWLAIPQPYTFMVPLLVCGQFDLASAANISEKAVDKNGWLWVFRVCATIVCMLAGAIHGLCVIPLLPMTGALLYVAYQDVFWNRLPSAATVAVDRGVYCSDDPKTT